MNNVFRGVNETRQVPLIKFQTEMQKAAEITYLEANKQEKTHRLTSSDVSKWEKRNN